MRRFNVVEVPWPSREWAAVLDELTAEGWTIQSTHVSSDGLLVIAWRVK